MPKDIIVTNMALPPYETKGKGTPTTGINPITIDILTIKYKKILVVKPAIVNLVKVLFALYELTIP